MNEDYTKIRSILMRLRNDYRKMCSTDADDPSIPITERDIVSEIYCRLKRYCKNKNLYPHTEIKPAPSARSKPNSDRLKSLRRIDVVILQDGGNTSWLKIAKRIQNRYKKGMIQARFSSVPLRFFHTAIEVKIQSSIVGAKKDINTLMEIRRKNKKCNCFFVLLNARGLENNHANIISYAKSKQIDLIEFSAQCYR